MKRIGFLMVVGLLLTAADCFSPEESTPNEPSGLADPQTAQVLLSLVADNGGYEGIIFSTPQGMKWMMEGAAKRKQGNICTPYIDVVVNDSTDADGDGLPVDVRFSVNCDTTFIDPSTGMEGRVILVGDMTILDPNDADPWVGFLSLEGPVQNQYFYEYIRMGTEEYEAGFSGSVETRHEGQTFTASKRMALMMRVQMATGAESMLVYVRYAHISFTPTDSTWTPDLANVVSGELALADTLLFQDSGGNDVSYVVTTPTPLWVDANCDSDGDGVYGDPSSGEILITDGQHELLVRWTGCGTREVFLDGQPFNPAL